MAKQSDITGFTQILKKPLATTVVLKEEIQPSVKAVPEYCDTVSTNSTPHYVPVTETDSDEDIVVLESQQSSSSSVPATNKTKRKLQKYVQKCTEDYMHKFKWLCNKDGNSFCNLCQKRIVGGNFHLLRHQNPDSHKKKSKKMKYTVDVRHYTNNAVSEKETFNRKVKKCEQKFAMFIAEHNLPLNLMEHLPKLLVSAVPDSEILKRVNCSRTKTTALQKNFKEESEHQLSVVLQQTKFSLIVDESTDVSVQKCLAILVRYVEKEKVRNRLLSLVEVKDCSAEGIVQEILKALRSMSIPINNLIGFAADNASVMMGKYNGVQAKLREINPEIFVVGCICHSLHLCVSAVSFELPKRIEDFVRDIYNYLSCSPKRLGEFSEFQEMLYFSILLVWKIT